MDYAKLSDKVKSYATQFFKSHDDSKHVYHNLAHTEAVVANVRKIAAHYHLDEKSLFAVTTAAWFHDAGYFSGATDGHEERGAALAQNFLKENGVDDDIATMVHGCILATKFPQSPHTFLEQIVCDADLFHFGTDEFSEKNKLMHKEVEIIKGIGISKKEWRKNTIRLLEGHHFFTDYCRSLLESKQQENLDRLKKKDSEKKNGEERKVEEHKGELATLVNKYIDTEETTYPEFNEEPANSSPAEKDKTKKRKRSESGINTIFKITSNNNQRLSSQADSKAHIMIQVNSIIISVIISMLFRKIEEYRFLSVPAVMLVSVNVLTIIFSVLATRPQIPKGTFSKQDIEDKKVNLLFFGNFYKMSLEEYASGMLALMDEYDFLYMSLIRDVYFQGKVLGKKYQLLRISYSVFMYGLVLSVLGFIIALVFFTGK